MSPFSLSLASKDVEPLIDLQSLFNEIYEQARFDMKID
ncbi:DUF4058 family protein [Scytonema sp. PRP1]